MPDPAAVTIEQGTYRLYIRGAAHLVLSPEGDSHRLVRLGLEAGGGYCGTILAVTGRAATLMERLPTARPGEAAPLAAGAYRLWRGAFGTELAFIPNERPGGQRDGLGPFAGAAAWRIAVRHPRTASGGCAVLPPALARRLQGRSMVPADPPHFLDYAGVQLLLTPAVAVAAAARALPAAAEARR